MANNLILAIMQCRQLSRGKDTPLIFIVIKKEWSKIIFSLVKYRLIVSVGIDIN